MPTVSCPPTMHCCEELGSVFSINSTQVGTGCYLCPPKTITCLGSNSPGPSAPSHMAGLKSAEQVCCCLWYCWHSLGCWWLSWCPSCCSPPPPGPSQQHCSPARQPHAGTEVRGYSRCSTLYLCFLNFTRLLSSHSSYLQLEALSLWLYWLVLLVRCHLHTIWDHAPSLPWGHWQKD